MVYHIRIRTTDSESNTRRRVRRAEGNPHESTGMFRGRLACRSQRCIAQLPETIVIL
ncbi:hypothetical protein [Enterocloster bolteae]|uniref:hypothetical protein n=1 Tax=Enterocloster bolteae TaxID=208479 RepID=UPI00039B78EE|nr:hypothetical protein [Enterocloster bolteae]